MVDFHVAQLGHAAVRAIFRRASGIDVSRGRHRRDRFRFIVTTRRADLIRNNESAVAWRQEESVDKFRAGCPP